MKKAVYIHGLGGSGKGSSAANIRKALEGEYELSASTYDLLKPEEALNMIRQDTAGADLIIASSLGAFYASILDPRISRGILLNPCLMPDTAIEPLLYEEQKLSFNRDKCLREWNEMKVHWKGKHQQAWFAGIFSDNDEFFHFQDVFDENIKKEYMADSRIIHGTHEIAKNEIQLKAALEAARDVFEDLQKKIHERRQLPDRRVVNFMEWTRWIDLKKSTLKEVIFLEYAPEEVLEQYKAYLESEEHKRKLLIR